jgi:O-antigen ligase
VAFLLVGNLVSELIWLKLITWLFLLYGALYTLGRLVPFASHYLRNIFQPGATTGSIFWVWLLVIPFSQALFNKDLKKIVRAALLVLVVAVLYVAIIRASGWKSGYIPPLAGLAVISALWLKKKAWIVAPIGLFLLWQISQSAVETDQYSTTTRLAAWKIVFELSAISPIFGMGFANYYWYTPLIPILGWRVNFNSHSQYIDIIAQVGIFGLLCLMWVFFAITKLGWQLKDQAQEGFEKAYVYGAIGGIAGTLVAGFFVDWILPFVYNIGLDGFRSSMLSWIFLGGLVSIEQMVRNRKSSTLENAPQQ